MTEPLSASFKRSTRQQRKSSNRPFSIRLSDTERLQLEAEAGGQALGTYVRARLLNSAVRRRRSATAQHKKALCEVLGNLGRLQIASNMSDLAAAVKAGAIAMTPDLEWEIRSACRDLRDMRSMLMRALGLQPEAGQ